MSLMAKQGTDDTFVTPGDVFVKTWGHRELIYMILAVPPANSGRKIPYIRVHTGSVETCYRRTHRSWTCDSYKGKRDHRYVGNVPEGWMVDVVRGRT
jgi:hypothetical protein